MNRIACQYAIVRFLPFIETGEFANVGIIMMAAKERYFGFKLQTTRHARVTRFFEELDAKVFKAAMHDIEAELTRVNQLLLTQGFDTLRKDSYPDFAKTLFNEVVRQREVMVRFSEPRTVLATDPAKTLEELYEFYVGRNFVNKEYHETLMEKGLRQLLNQAALGERYAQHKVGNDDFHVAFPFVAMAGDRPKTIIKPLNLGQDDPTKIRERGNNWQFKIKELERRHFLPPHVLFAVEGPVKDTRRMHAYEDAQKMLEDAGVTVLPFAGKDKILEFAAAQAR